MFSFVNRTRADRSFPFFFFNDTATTEIYTLSLHDALPICPGYVAAYAGIDLLDVPTSFSRTQGDIHVFGNPHIWTSPLNARSEEHTSELQSRLHLVCRLLLEKKKKQQRNTPHKPQPQTYDL